MPISKVLKRTGLIDLDLTGTAPQNFVTIDVNHLSMFEDNFDTVSSSSYQTFIKCDLILMAKLKSDFTSSTMIEYKTSFLRTNGGSLSEAIVEREWGALTNAVGSVTSNTGSSSLNGLAIYSTIGPAFTSGGGNMLFPSVTLSPPSLIILGVQNRASATRSICLRWYLTMHGSDLAI